MKSEAKFTGDEGFVTVRDVSFAEISGDDMEVSGVVKKKDRKNHLSHSMLAGLNETKPRIAIQAHVFNTEVLPELTEYVNKMSEAFDLFVSTDTKEKKKYIDGFLAKECKCRRFETSIFENRGRDVAPFILQMKDAIGRYEYICHIHSKKSVHTEGGEEWRNANLSALFDNSKLLLDYLDENDKVGLVMPHHPESMNDFMIWMGSLNDTRAILERVYRFLEIEGKIIPAENGMSEGHFAGNLKTADSSSNRNSVSPVKLPARPEFPAGNMFWARTSAVSPLFKCGISGEDFQKEYGQLSHTTAHAIERCWVYLVGLKGYESVRLPVSFNCKG